ncbi:MAG: hypothetical protein ACMUJM_13600 [bacterium]
MLYIGIVLIVSSISFIGIAVSFASYYTHHNKVIKRFERKGNKILTLSIIDDLCKEEDEDCRSVMKIFHSAIVNHTSVDNIRYYTKYPYSIFSSFIDHDGHRRALIAKRIGELVQKDKLLDDEVVLAVSVLKQLTNSSREYSYTQLIAWNSLSKIDCYKKPLFDIHIKKKELLKSLARKGAGSIGAQKFVFNALEKKEMHADSLEKDIKDFIHYIFNIDNFTVKALLYYNIQRSSLLRKEKKEQLLEGIKIPKRLDNFIKDFDYFSYGFKREELIIGLKNMGICAPPYVKHTSEGRIAAVLIEECLMEVCMPIAIYSYDDSRVKDKAIYESISLFERDDPRVKNMIGEQFKENLFLEGELSFKKRKEYENEKSYKNNDQIREGLACLEGELKKMANLMSNPKKKARQKVWSFIGNR